MDQCPCKSMEPLPGRNGIWSLITFQPKVIKKYTPPNYPPLKENLGGDSLELSPHRDIPISSQTSRMLKKHAKLLATISATRRIVWRVVYRQRDKSMVTTGRSKKVIKWLNMILSGCWFRHDNLIRYRDEHGVLHYECQRCGHRGLWYGAEITSRTYTDD